jgi:hypothetical protein
MSSKTIKKLLMSLIVVGVLASFTVGGTFAVLNGQSANPNNSIASGSILMANSVGGGASCYSDLTAANNNVNTACTQPFSTGLLYPITSSAPPVPPQTTVAYADMTITSAGLPLVGGNPTASSLPATLMLYMPNCDASTTTGAGYTGGTNPCCPGLVSGLPGSVGACPTGSLDFFIQEYTSSAFTTALSSCVYPYSSSSACTFQSDTLGNFFGLYHDNTHYFTIGSIAAGATRYFRIGMAEPINASNNLQGETATFSLYWHMEQ